METTEHLFFAREGERQSWASENMSNSSTSSVTRKTTANSQRQDMLALETKKMQIIESRINEIQVAEELERRRLHVSDEYFAIDEKVISCKNSDFMDR